MGRPSKYTPELAAQICDMLSTGLSLRSICQEPQMPPESTVREWVIYDSNGFAAQYAHARELGVDCMADRLLELAETPVRGEKIVIKADGSREVTVGDAVDRSRLTVDTMKWYVSKLAPKRYGDRLELAGKVDTSEGWAAILRERRAKRAERDKP